MRLRRRPAPSWAVLLILVCLLVLRWVLPAPPRVETLFEDAPVGVQRVVDGDTLLLESGHRIRLIGVDTPETKHPDRPVEELGVKAHQFTAELIGRGPVRLEFDRERRDQYRRVLAYVYLPDGRMLNEEIIRAGYSRAETRFPYRSDRKRRFLAAEHEARAAKRGIWAAASEGT